MCPRLVWAKIRPGDLVWPMLHPGVKLYKTEDAGEADNANDIVGEVPFQMSCLMICFAAGDDSVMLVLGPNCRLGWTHRLFWQPAGVEKPEQEYA